MRHTIRVRKRRGRRLSAHGHLPSPCLCGGRSRKSHSDLNARQPRTSKIASAATARSSGPPSQRAADDGSGDSDEGGLGATPPGVTAGGFDCSALSRFLAGPNSSVRDQALSGATVRGRRLSRVCARSSVLSGANDHERDIRFPRANHVRWPAVVELRRNTIAGLGPRGGWLRVCPDRKTKCLARSASESLLIAEDRALTGVGKRAPLRGHLYFRSSRERPPKLAWCCPRVPEVC